MSTPMSVEQYRDLILQDVAALPSAQLPLAQCLGLTTTAPVTAHVAVPPFTNSAMNWAASTRSARSTCATVSCEVWVIDITSSRRFEDVTAKHGTPWNTKME